MGPDKKSMQITSVDGPGERVLSLSGRIGSAQVPELGALLLAAVDRADGDVLIDTHRVTAFDDSDLVALTTARKRAKFRRNRIVVLDGENGVVAAGLRRSGMHIRMPVCPDAATASGHLAADRAARAARAARARLTMRLGLPQARDPAQRNEHGHGKTDLVPPRSGMVVRRRTPDA